MTKRFIILLSACFLLSSLPAVQADLLPPSGIVDPNRKPINIDRFFGIDDESDSVPVKIEPGSEDVIVVPENGNLYHISPSYNYRGVSWGFTEQGISSRDWLNDWLPMNQLLLRYDHASFIEEYKDKFYPYVGNYEELKTAKRIVLWSWPGSGVMYGSYDAETIGNIKISNAYMDKNGRQWVFADNVEYGDFVNVWICLSDPSNEVIPAFNPPRPMPWSPAKTISGDSVSNDTSVGADLSVCPDIKQTIYSTDNFTYENVVEFGKSVQGEHIGSSLSDETNTAKSQSSAPLLIIILVTFLVVSTAVLILVFWKPNDKA